MSPCNRARDPADGGQLEDEPQPPRGHRAGPEARLHAGRQEADYGQVEVVGAAAVHRPAQRCRRWSTATGCSINYGAQDLSAHDSGAYTGEISAAMLAKLGCTYVVVGHSERREYHARDRRGRQRQGARPLAAGMTPILCVGEGLEVRQAGDHVAHTLAQLDGALGGLQGRAGRRPGRRLRAGLGHRHRRGGHPGGRAGGLRGDPRPARRAATATSRGRRPRSSTADR